MKLFITNPIQVAVQCQNIITIVVLLFVPFISSNAQSLVTEISLATANLNSQEAETYQNLQQDSFTKNLKLVSIGDPKDFIDDRGILTYTLPGLENTIVAQIIDITQTENSFGWIGKMTNQTGTLAIYEIDGLWGSWIQTEQRFFVLMPIRNGIGTLRELKGDIGDVMDCMAPTDAESQIDFCTEEYNTCLAQIDILVLLPPDTWDYINMRFGSYPIFMNIWAYLGTYYSLQVAFINSDIPNKQIKIIFESFDFQYTFPLNCGSGITSLSTQAASRRSAVGADLVVLLTSLNYPCGAGVAIGNGDNPGQPAFCIVEAPWFIHPRWTFAHEVGHLLAARHSRPDPGPGDDNNPNCGHGWTIGNNRFQRSIMAPWFGDMNPTDVRVLHYSNPNVSLNGDASGTTTSDNAKTIRNAACAVSEYLASKLFSVHVFVPIIACSGPVPVSTYAFVQQPTFGNPGVGPYTYEWRWNISGDFENDPGTMFGTTPIAQLTIPNNSDHLWIRLKVTSSDNVVLYKYSRVFILGPCMQAIEGGDPSSDNNTLITHSVSPNASSNDLQEQGGGSSSENKIFLTSTVYPNPAANEINVAVNTEIERTANIVINNSIGTVVYSLNRQFMVKGENRFQIDVSSFPVGFYSLSILSGSKSGNESHKFIISK